VPLGARDELRALREALDVISAASEPNGSEPSTANIFGVDDATVVAVARLVNRAHRALHENKDPKSAAVQRRCAEVLFNALPETLSQRLILADAVAQVHYLAREHDVDRAVPRATAALVGWTEIATRFVARAVDVVVSRSMA
jgi:hypothetical protein